MFCFCFVSRWNDSAITSLNDFPLPGQQIELVLQLESMTFVKDLMTALQRADPLGFTLVPANKPVWPTFQYAKFTYVSAIEGPPSYVLQAPYTLGFALVGISKKLGVAISGVVNNAGVVVHPTYISIQAALREKGVLAQRATDGSFVSYAWTADLVGALGPLSWPFTQATSLVIPKTFARQGCVARSELAKFLTWMLRSDKSHHDHTTTQNSGLSNTRKQTERNDLKQESNLCSRSLSQCSGCALFLSCCVVCCCVIV